MTRTRATVAAAVAVAVTAGALLLSGCGVRPTGVIGAGEPATGLTKGLRLYYVSRSGRLEGVSRPDRRIKALPDVLKFLGEGPDAAEQKRGLTNPLGPPRSFDVVGTGAKVVLRDPGAHFPDGLSEAATGQLVCTLARAQSLLAEGVRPDDVQVTLDGEGPPAGPYRCGSYLAR